MKGILMNTEMVKAILDGHKTVTRRLIKPVALGITYEDGSPARKSPYQPGDVLYVRETWCKFVAEHIIDGVWYEYKANATPALEATRKAYGYKWRPSIHMPKEAARIFLRVIGVRVERLQEMTWRDARAEGLVQNKTLFPNLRPRNYCNSMNFGIAQSRKATVPNMAGRPILGSGL